MPRYEVRLEAPDSDHFRVTTLTAADEDSAADWCMRREYRTCAYELPAEQVMRLQKAERASKLDRDGRAALLAHRQREPYEVAYVREA